MATNFSTGILPILEKIQDKEWSGVWGPGFDPGDLNQTAFGTITVKFPTCEDVWPIVDGKFHCLNDLGELATGTFNSSTSASGQAFEGEGGKGEFCSANWSATPN